MKFLITGDWHLDEKKPKNRKEGYVEEQKDKVRQIIKIAKEHEVRAILQPGDFFNTSKVSDACKAYWIAFFKSANVPVYTIPGQHDMRYHSSNIDNTPMGVLRASKVIRVINCPNVFGKELFLNGAGWEQEIVNPDRSCSCSILLLHMLVSEKPLYPGHSNVHPGWILDKYDYNLIVCGDNHKHFDVQYHSKRKLLINCGSLMRSTIDQDDHEPCVYLYDTEDPENPRIIDLKVKPFEEVMNIEEAVKEKERNKELEDFVEGLSDTNIDGLDFKRNLLDHLHLNKSKIGDGVIAIINEVIG